MFLSFNGKSNTINMLENVLHLLISVSGGIHKV